MLVTKEESEEIAAHIKTAEQEISQVLCQRTLPSNSSIWSRRDSESGEKVRNPDYISIGYNELPFRRVQSDKFVTVLD
jgi:hypothetical protein